MFRIVSILLVSALVPLSHGQGYSGTSNTNCPSNLAPTNLRVMAYPDAYYLAGPPPSGMLVDLLNALATEAGVTFTLTTFTGTIIGNQNANKSWDGTLLGTLINDKSDLALADITINSNREKNVDFLVPYSQYQMQILYNTQFGLNNSVQYVVRNNADLGALRNSKDPAQQAIYPNIQAGLPGSIVADDPAGLAKVLSGNFAYVTESPFTDKSVAANAGKVARSPTSLGGFYLSLAVKQGSPLQEILNIALLQLEEAGTVQSLLNKYNLNN